MVKEIKQLKQEVNDIKTDKFVETLQIPVEQLEESGKKLHIQGKNWRPILESEIDEAQSNTICATQAAKYLGINYRTYRKWCLIYNKLKINPWKHGDKRIWDPNKRKYPLSQILEGKFPQYPPNRLKDLLIRSGTKEAKCEVCHFAERRMTDNKIPILINFRDGDERNHKLENLQMLCYNHYFTMGRGYIRRGKVEFNFLDDFEHNILQEK